MKRRTAKQAQRILKRVQGPAPIIVRCPICKLGFRSSYERKRHGELSACEAGTDAAIARGVVVATL